MPTYSYVAHDSDEYDRIVFGLDRLRIPYVAISKLADNHDVDNFYRGNLRKERGLKSRRWFIEVNTDKE